MVATDTWLDEREARLWRTWLRVNAEIGVVLQRRLQRSGMSIADYEVLVHLTDQAEARLRISDLADLLHWERSRLSHQLSRMEKRDLVQRSECVEDGRGALIALTTAGRSAIESVAPDHVAAVRGMVFDVLSEDEQRRTQRVLDKVADGLSSFQP